MLRVIKKLNNNIIQKMHIIRGINISKKIVKILGKKIKQKKVKPLHFLENENVLFGGLKLEDSPLHFQMSNPISNIGHSVPGMKREETRIYKAIRHLIKNISLSKNQLFFLYFVMKFKSDSILENSVKRKKVCLGCSIKNNFNMRGMKIIAVKGESTAEKLNLRANDVILKIDNNEINSIEEFNKSIQSGELNKSMMVERKEGEVETIIKFDFKVNELKFPQLMEY